MDITENERDQLRTLIRLHGLAMRYMAGHEDEHAKNGMSSKAKKFLSKSETYAKSAAIFAADLGLSEDLNLIIDLDGYDA